MLSRGPRIRSGAPDNDSLLFVGCNKDSEQFFFFSKKRTELEAPYTLLRACSITGASLQFCSSFFFTSLMKKSMITVRLQY